MKNIQAIVLDLDGTLLNSEKQISATNKEVLFTCRSKGIAIIIATARPPRLVKTLPSFLREFGYIIYYNGALIVNEQKKFEQHYPIPVNKSKQIYQYIQKRWNEQLITFEVNDAWMANRELWEDEKEIFGYAQHPFIIDEQGALQLSPSKILLPNTLHVNDLELTFKNHLNITYSEAGKIIEIMDRYVSKEDSVKKVLQKMNISLNNTIVFGDDFNDIGLFKTCRYAVAMKNAVDEVKRIATFITETNDQDGVAKFLNKII